MRSFCSTSTELFTLIVYLRNTVTATASTREKLECLLGFPQGPTHVVNYKTQDFAEEVKKTTDGKGVNVIIDFVGQSHWNKNIDALAYDGRMTLLALLSGEFLQLGPIPKFTENFAGAEVANVNLAPILYKRLRIQGSTLRSRTVDYQAELVARSVREYLLVSVEG